MQAVWKEDRRSEGRTGAAVARSPAGSADRSLVWKIWLPIPILLLLLDATFNWYFWNIPKLTGWWEDRAYQFLYDAHHLSRPLPDGATRVLAFGSSVAACFDPHQVQSLLEVAEPPGQVQVDRVLMAGTKPSDFRLFFETEGSAMHAGAAVVLLNLVDFLNPGFEEGKKLQVQSVLPPWPTLKERYAEIPSIGGKIDLLAASTSNLYRYRNAARSAVKDHLKFSLRWLQALGSRKGAYGLYSDGYTHQRFGLPASGRETVDLDYYIHPAWIRQRGRVGLTFKTNGQVLAERIESQAGWRSIRLQLPGSDGVVHVSADSAWNARAAGLSDDARLLGVRVGPLPPAAAAANGNKPPVEYPPYDGSEFYPLLRMGHAVGEEFIQRWQRTISADTPFAVRFRAYEREKLGVRERRFEPTGEYAELERLVSDFSRRGMSVVIVNTPENPLILNAYRDSPYYSAHLQFFRNLAAVYPGVRFHDLASALPAEDFNDWHHVNYIGRIKLGPVFVSLLQEALDGAKGPVRPKA